MAQPALKLTEQQRAFQSVFGRARIHKLEQGVKIAIVEVEPMQAQALLDSSNTNNRKLRGEKLRQYKEEMQRKRWRVQNTCIITENGKLIDGQHRMHAIVESGLAQWLIFQIVPDADAAAANLVTDAGAVRSLADTIHFLGVDRPARVAGVLVHERNHRVLGSPMKMAQSNKSDYLKLLSEIKSKIQPALDVVPRGLASVIGVKPSILDFFAYHFEQIDHGMAEMFFELLKDDSQLKRSDAVKVLREELQRLDRLRKTKKIASVNVETTFMIAKTWNLHYTDQPAKVADIRFKARDEFPPLKGEDGA